jgi:hypothetical protein
MKTLLLRLWARISRKLADKPEQLELKYGLAARALPLLTSQFSICLVERNGAFELTGRIQNTNFTGAKARAGFRRADGLIFLPKHRLDARALKDFPAPAVRFDFDYCHRVGCSARLDRSSSGFELH